MLQCMQLHGLDKIKPFLFSVGSTSAEQGRLFCNKNIFRLVQKYPSLASTQSVQFISLNVFYNSYE